MRILLVDDEASLLSLLSQYLTRSGHETALAETVTAALDLATQPFDAAVVDLSLPDGSGEEVVKALLRAGTTANIVISTGYPYDPPPAFAGRVIVLQKPFLPRALLNVLS